MSNRREDELKGCFPELEALEENLSQLSVRSRQHTSFYDFTRLRITQISIWICTLSERLPQKYCVRLYFLSLTRAKVSPNTKAVRPIGLAALLTSTRIVSRTLSRIVCDKESYLCVEQFTGGLSLGGASPDYTLNLNSLDVSASTGPGGS